MIARDIAKLDCQVVIGPGHNFSPGALSVTPNAIDRARELCHVIILYTQGWFLNPTTLICRQLHRDSTLERFQTDISTS
jgi:hypothetical protein